MCDKRLICTDRVVGSGLRVSFWIFCPFCLFDQCLVYIIFIGTHLHLHGCGIIAQFQMPEMIKEDQYAKADPDRVGDLQNGKTEELFPMTRV